MKFSKPVGALSLSALLLVTACTDPSQIGKGNNTQGGALAGALAGALLGSAVSGSGDKRKGAIIGGLVGAAAGGAFGQKLDQQAADLRNDLGSNQVDVVNTGSELVVTMPQDILFAVGSANLRSDLRRDLATVASNLQAYPDTTVQILGHTDNTGGAAFNQTLSQRRAEAVANVLIQNGVSASRIRSTGRGEDAPKATNLTPEGRAANRRVEIVIRPNA